MTIKHTSQNTQKHHGTMAEEQLKEYQSQLADLEELLEVDPSDESILKLKSDLVELIALTKQELTGDAAAADGEEAATTTTTEEPPQSPITDGNATTALNSTTGVIPEETNPSATVDEPPKKKLKRVKDFEVPSHLQIRDTDTEKEKNKKKRAVKALKNKHREKQRDYESTKKQQSWQSFSKKKKKGGKSTSIFATQDGVNAKVGVVSGSNKSLTGFGERKRHKYT